MNKIIFYFCASFLFIHTATAQFGNYFAGTNAGTGNTGSYVTGVGYNAVHKNNSGSYNSALGYATLYSNTTGYGNTAVGYKSLFLNTKGSRNTAIGDSSLYSNTTGVANTANGYGAMFHNTIGYSNTATGQEALFNNTTGFLNTATGFQSLYKNTKGIGNTANGHSALYSNTTGNYNTSVGDQSLFYNTTGNYNTANGFGALFFNTTGHNNTAAGNSALIYNASGFYNTASGDASLYSNTTGSYNSASGDSSLFTNTTGSYNTAMGYKADVTQPDFFNATAIGYNAKADASNTIRIGNENIVSIGGQIGWTNFSDARIKNDIKDNVPGLAFINLLRPVTYHYNIKAEKELLGIKNDDKPDTEIEKINFTGLLAQEVEKAARKINYDFSGVDKSGNIMGLRYSDFVTPLIKAVQELSKQNEELTKNYDAKIEILEKEMAALKSAILQVNQLPNSKAASLFNPSISQNIPNPFSNSTTINYTLPNTYSSAKIIITDKNGKTLKEANISGSGKGSLKVDAALLTSGSYNYSFYIDEKLIDSKQMMLLK